jgi:hypothetical protein
VHPAAFVDTGAVQPVGTATSTSPLEIPPAAAVYVNVIVLPVDDTGTLAVGVVSVPDPSPALVTLIDGDNERFVSVPPEVDFSDPCHDWDPVVLVAVAPSVLVHDPPEVAP